MFRISLTINTCEHYHFRGMGRTHIPIANIAYSWCFLVNLCWAQPAMFLGPVFCCWCCWGRSTSFPIIFRAFLTFDFRQFYRPVNLRFNLKQIATETFLPPCISMRSPKHHIKNLPRDSEGKYSKNAFVCR